MPRNEYLTNFLKYDGISVNSNITYSHPFHRSPQQRHDKLLLGHLEASPAWTFSKIYPSYYQNLNSRKTILTAGTSPLWCNSSFKNIIVSFIHTYMDRYITQNRLKKNNSSPGFSLRL